MGGKADDAQKSAWSVELCGGTHVQQTGDIALLKITSESAVAGGVRRSEAVTHKAGREWLKASPDQLPGRISQLLDDRRKMERELQQLRQKLATASASGGDAETIGNLSFIGKILDDTPAKELKPMADSLRSDASATVICLVAISEGKASVVVCVSDDMTSHVSAVELVRLASAAVGGKGGGGRADMAQAGGPDASSADKAIDAVRQALSS